MSIPQRRGRPITQPTPAQVKAVREAAGLTQAECSGLVWVNIRTWQGWEQGEYPTPLGLWELFLISRSAAGAGGRLPHP